MPRDADADGGAAARPGPFRTQREAAAAARHIYGLPPGAAWSLACHKMLEDACSAAGAELGSFDHATLLWLSGWEPSTVAVLAGIITRAGRGRVSAGGA